MAFALMLVGGLLALIGTIIVVIAAFQDSFIWGLGVLLFWPVSFLFVFTHWEETKKAFLIQVAGLALVVVGTLLGGSQTAQDMPTPGSGGGRQQIEIPD